MITSNSTVNLTVNTGNTLCINSGVTYSGNITLNGGVLCNQGVLTKITFVSGTFNNYGRFNQTAAININSNGDVTINNFPNSIFGTAGAFNHSPGNSATNLNLNTYSGSRFIITGSFSSNKGNVFMRIGLPDPNGAPGGDGTTGGAPALFNIGGQFNVSNSSLEFVLLNGSFANVSGALSLDAKYNKTIINAGSFNVNNTFNVGGNGQNTGTVTIFNYSTFNITKHLNLAYNNGVAVVNNYGIFEVRKSVTVSKDGNTVLNSNAFNIVNDLNIERGSVTNNGVMTVRDADIKFGVLTNNNQINLLRDLITSNAQATVTNNSYLDVVRELNNKGTIVLAESSFINATDYFNQNAGSILGPTTPTDYADYAKIFISGSSNNNGVINGKIIVYDASLLVNNSNTNTGFDQVNNPSNITGDIAFAVKAIGPGNPPAVNCILLQQMYYVGANGPITICAGSSAPISAQFYKWVSFKSFFIKYTIGQPQSIPNSSYVWMPGNLIGPNQSVSPTSTTNYTVTVTFGGCTFTTVVLVNVLPNTITSVLTPTTVKCSNIAGNLTINGTASGGVSPYTYSWTPSGLTTPIISVPPVHNTAYSVQVTAANGCQKTFTTLVFVSNISAPVLNAYLICPSGSTLINAAATGGIGPYNYVWNTWSNNILGPPLYLSPGGNVGPQTSSPPTSTSYSVQITDAAGCVRGYFLSVLVSPAIVFNPPYTYYTGANVPVLMGMTPIASGGSPPYLYNWTGPGLSNNSIQNPYSNVATSTNYNLQITDNIGCVATQPFNVVILSNTNSYAIFKKKLDAGYYKIINNNLYFTIDGEYNPSTNLNYKIYDINRNIITSSNPILPVSNGDNRYFINVAPFGLVANQFYILELTNEKSEIFLLKIRY